MVGPIQRHCDEVLFASFQFGGFITAIVMNPPERNLGEYKHCTGTLWARNLLLLIGGLPRKFVHM